MSQTQHITADLFADTNAINTVELDNMLAAVRDKKAQDGGVPAITMLINFLIGTHGEEKNWGAIKHVLTKIKDDGIYPIGVERTYNWRDKKLFAHAPNKPTEVIPLENAADAAKLCKTNAAGIVVARNPILGAYMAPNKSHYPSNKNAHADCAYVDASRDIGTLSDLHGGFGNKALIKAMADEIKINRREMINGDYADRGANSLRNILIPLLFNYRYKDEGKVILLRGNHDFPCFLNTADWLIGGNKWMATLGASGKKIREELNSLINDIFSQYPTFMYSATGHLALHGAPSHHTEIQDKAKKFGAAPFAVATGACLEADGESLLSQALEFGNFVKKPLTGHRSEMAGSPYWDSITGIEEYNGHCVTDSLSQTNRGMTIGGNTVVFNKKLGIDSTDSGHSHTLKVQHAVEKGPNNFMLQEIKTDAAVTVIDPKEYNGMSIVTGTAIPSSTSNSHRKLSREIILTDGRVIVLYLDPTNKKDLELIQAIRDDGKDLDEALERLGVGVSSEELIKRANYLQLKASSSPSTTSSAPSATTITTTTSSAVVKTVNLAASPLPKYNEDESGNYSILPPEPQAPHAPAPALTASSNNKVEIVQDDLPPRTPNVLTDSPFIVPSTALTASTAARMSGSDKESTYQPFVRTQHQTQNKTPARHSLPPAPNMPLLTREALERFEVGVSSEKLIKRANDLQLKASSSTTSSAPSATTITTTTSSAVVKTVDLAASPLPKYDEDESGNYSILPPEPQAPCAPHVPAPALTAPNNNKVKIVQDDLPPRTPNVLTDSPFTVPSTALTASTSSNSGASTASGTQGARANSVILQRPSSRRNAGNFSSDLPNDSANSYCICSSNDISTASIVLLSNQLGFFANTNTQNSQAGSPPRDSVTVVGGNNIGR